MMHLFLISDDKPLVSNDVSLVVVSVLQIIDDAPSLEGNDVLLTIHGSQLLIDTSVTSDGTPLVRGVTLIVDNAYN